MGDRYRIKQRAQEKGYNSNHISARADAKIRAARHMFEQFNCMSSYSSLQASCNIRGWNTSKTFHLIHT